MRYEMDLIKRKAATMLIRVLDQETRTLLFDIVRLSDACLEVIEGVDANLTDICLQMRRVTTDIK